MIEDNYTQSAIDYSALWNRTYGGFSSDRFQDIIHCADGGYAIVGTTYSFGTTNGDIWVVRTDNSGDAMWITTLNEEGSSSTSLGRAIVECSNGDFVVVGSFSEGSGYDCCVDRIDMNGNPIWSRLIGDNVTQDHGADVLETSSGNILILGRTNSWGAGDYDILVACLTPNGNEIWTRTYGGTGYDWARKVVASSSGGYAIIADTDSYGAGATDVWFVRIDDYGNHVWNQTYGRSGSETGGSLEECGDGGFILGGTSRSHGDPSGDFWAIKVDDLGVETWNQTYPGTGTDYTMDIVEATNGGYTLVGVSDDMGPMHSARLIRIDLDGTELWTNWYGGSLYDYANGLIETSPEEFVFVGFTDSYGADSWDGWLVLVPGEPELTDPPDELHFEFGHVAGVTLWAESVAPIHMWWLDDTSVFNILKIGNNQGAVYRLLPPDVGYYEVDVHVNNTAGHETVHTIFIYVDDTTAPV